MDIYKTTLTDLLMFNSWEDISVFGKLDLCTTAHGSEQLRINFSTALKTQEEIVAIQQTLQLIIQKQPQWPTQISNGTVMVVENFFGVFLSVFCPGWVGGFGLAPGAKIGELGAVFEAVHGSAPDIAGQGIANPTALMLSAIQMLHYIGERDAAQRLETALFDVFKDGTTITKDLGGTAKTNEFARAIEEKIKAV